jgi:hypothetical protein
VRYLMEIYLMELYLISIYGNSLHTENTFSCTEFLKMQRFALHFLLHCIYAEFPSSDDESAKLQFSIESSTNSLYSMLFFFKSLFTRFTVPLLGNGFRYAT